MCRAGASAWCVEAVETAVRFGECGLAIEGRVQVGKARSDLRVRFELRRERLGFARVRPLLFRSLYGWGDDYP